jgi:alcohol dehydrogenase
MTADEGMTATPTGQYLYPSTDKVLFGPGSVDRLADELDRVEARRVLLVTTQSIASGPAVYHRVQEIMGERLAATFSGARQHAPSGTVVALVGEIERQHPDLLVSLGGGSVIDTTKAAALAYARDAGSFLTHLSIPTTLSASEFSGLFGVTDEQTRVKAGSNNPFVMPSVAILDAAMTEETPDWLWLGSGVRAIDHAVETVYAPDHQPATDAPALEAIRLLFHYLPRSVEQDGRQDARQQCQIAAWLSFFGVGNITLGLSHVLGREIGPRYDVPHGFASAVLLPHVMTYLLPETVERQALIARAIGVETHDRAESEIAQEAPGSVSDLVGKLGLPQRLRDLGVAEGDLTDLAHGRRDVLEILQAAW